ncbi:MAG: GNAT family N-acetyltransferase [Bacteroidaceae bacterium]|nr:GNAT family N-acetyltransferase [Bacteroidaceae bacterium]
MSLSSFEFLPLTEDFEFLPFHSKDKDLNDFLFDDAKRYLAELMAVTYLFIDPQAQKTVAYFSLLNDKVAYDPEERSFWNRLNRKISNRKRRKTYPSVKIGRLAVSEDYSGQGIGCEILNFIKHAFTHGNRTGCRFITVDAYAAATDFYIKNGFDFFTKKDRNDATRLMYFDLKPFKDALDK